jgi:hypothetical protein
MLFQRRFLDAIARGEVTLAFRRWRRPTVRAGGRLRTAVGELAIDAVEPIDLDAVTTRDARRAGYADRDQLVSFLQSRTDGEVYRVALRLAGADSRIALRQRATLDAAERAELEKRLARLDRASRSGPWTEAVLRLISMHEARRAGDLAEMLGRERLPFKADVRKLKELGLTESLEVGYRLSPRGRALLAARDREKPVAGRAKSRGSKSDSA